MHKTGLGKIRIFQKNIHPCRRCRFNETFELTKSVTFKGTILDH